MHPVIVLHSGLHVFWHFVRIIGGILTISGRVQKPQDFRQYLVIPPGHLAGFLLQPSVAPIYWQSSRLSLAGQSDSRQHFFGHAVLGTQSVSLQAPASAQTGQLKGSSSQHESSGMQLYARLIFCLSPWKYMFVTILILKLSVLPLRSI